MTNIKLENILIIYNLKMNYSQKIIDRLIKVKNLMYFKKLIIKQTIKLLRKASNLSQLIHKF
jgi:hypothetical protein